MEVQTEMYLNLLLFRNTTKLFAFFEEFTQRELDQPNKQFQTAIAPLYVDLQNKFDNCIKMSDTSPSPGLHDPVASAPQPTEQKEATKRSKNAKKKGTFEK